MSYSWNFAVFSGLFWSVEGENLTYAAPHIVNERVHTDMLPYYEII